MADDSGPSVISRRRPERRTSAVQTVLMLILLAALVAISLPTCVLLFFGMLPTWVAFIVDRSRGRYAARCVGGINFAGAAPYALGLWGSDNSIGDAVALLLDPFSLLVMYGAAAFGWLLYLGMPPVIGTFLSIIAQRRVTELQDLQGRLVEEWGREIAQGGRAAGPPAATPGEGATVVAEESADEGVEEEVVVG